MKRFWLIGGGILALVVVLCGIGGFLLYRGLSDSATALEPEFRRAEKNGIPLVWENLEMERGVRPEDNAALSYKAAFDEWVKVRPEISDERWRSFAAGTALEEDAQNIVIQMAGMLEPMKQAVGREEIQWPVQYGDRAFGRYPVFAAVVDGVALVNPRYQGNAPQTRDYAALFKPSNDLLASEDPGSLRAASAIRLQVLGWLADYLPLYAQSQDVRGLVEIRSDLENVRAVDPLAVWRRTAFLQFVSWDEYESLTKEQKEFFGGSRRDHNLIIDSASLEILKFWNDAIEAAAGQSVLAQHLELGERVFRMRERNDIASMPLQKLWSLDSAIEGAGSVDWLIAEEQLQLMRQVLDVLIQSGGVFPEAFDCQRVSVIGEKPYSYEKTDRGFRISATPSDRLVPESALAQRKLVYEFVR